MSKLPYGANVKNDHAHKAADLRHEVAFEAGKLPDHVDFSQMSTSSTYLTLSLILKTP
jgi:hypothetical protein